MQEQQQKMGQEASLPEDPDFEEQAKAPPTAIDPDDSAPASVPQTAGANATGRQVSASKLMGVFRSNHHDSFEGKEAARAAAVGGNLYFDAEESLQFSGNNGASTQNARDATTIPK